MALYGEGEQLINIWVVDLVLETDRRRFVGIIVWDLDVHAPEAAFVGGVFWAVEGDEEFLPGVL